MPKGKGYNLHSDQLFFLATAQVRKMTQLVENKNLLLGYDNGLRSQAE